MSICSIEDVRAATSGTLWFQLYFMRDRAFTEALMARAHAARCPVLVLTLDLPLQALRRRDPKNGLAVPPRLTLQGHARFPDASALARGRDARPAPHLRQSRDILSRARHGGAVRMDGQSARLTRHMEGRRMVTRSLARQTRPQGHPRRRGCALRAQPPASMRIDRVESRRPPARRRDFDHRRAAAHRRGAAGRCEVLLDGGIHCGQSVLKALALGARGCLIGRSYLYGLAALGERGVSLALEIIVANSKSQWRSPAPRTFGTWGTTFSCRTERRKRYRNMTRAKNRRTGKTIMAATYNGVGDNPGPGTRNGFTDAGADADAGAWGSERSARDARAAPTKIRIRPLTTPTAPTISTTIPAPGPQASGSVSKSSASRRNTRPLSG